MTTFTRQPFDYGTNTAGSPPTNERSGDMQWQARNKLEAQLDEIKTVFTELYALLGVAEGSTDMGAYGLGLAITDLASVKTALDELDAAMGTVAVLPGGYAPDTTGVPMAGETHSTGIAKLHHLVTLLDESRRAAGSWDASTTAFPTTGLPPSAVNTQPILAGFLFDVTTAGTVDGIPFAIGDRVLALGDGGGATYAGNWLRLPRAVEISTSPTVRAIDTSGIQGAESLAAGGLHRHPLDVEPVAVASDGVSAVNTIEDLVLAAPATTLRRTLPPTAGTGLPIVFNMGTLGAGSVLEVAPSAGETLNDVVDGVLTFNVANSTVVAHDLAGGWSLDEGGGDFPAIPITADPNPAEERHYVTAYAGPFTLPPLAGFAIGDTVTLTNATGEAVVITPQTGEQIGDIVDKAFYSDTAGQHVRAEKTSATSWTVGPNFVLTQGSPDHHFALLSADAGTVDLFTFTVPTTGNYRIHHYLGWSNNNLFVDIATTPGGAARDVWDGNTIGRIGGTRPGVEREMVLTRGQTYYVSSYAGGGSTVADSFLDVIYIDGTTYQTGTLVAGPAIIADTGLGFGGVVSGANVYTDQGLAVPGGLQLGDEVVVRFGGGDSTSTVIDQDGGPTSWRRGNTASGFVQTVGEALQLQCTDAAVGLDRIFVKRSSHLAIPAGALPITNPPGTAGQVLTANGDGSATWT